MNKWKLFRLVMLLFAVVAAFFMPLEPKAKPPIEWASLAVIFMAIPIGLIFVIGIQAINPMTAKIWHKPNWNLSPLNFKEPLQFFHFGAYVFLAQGVVTLLRIVFSSVSFYLEALLPLVVWISMLIGIQLVIFAFGRKFSENT